MRIALLASMISMLGAMRYEKYALPAGLMRPLADKERSRAALSGHFRSLEPAHRD
jgi:hypothetical protein